MDLLEPQNLPFAAALCVIAVLAAMQVIGLADLFGDHDFDHDADGGTLGGLLSLLGVGRLPLSVWFGLFLLAFAGSGFGMQALAEHLTGAPLSALLASGMAAVIALPITGLLARPLGAVLPRDETTAISIDELVGRRAVITDGVARRGSPARARVADRHGMMHHVMVEPHEDSTALPAGDEVLLVRREGEAFVAIALLDRPLSPI